MTKFSKVLGTLTALPLLGAAVAAVADDERDSRAEQRAQMMKRYDSNGDGRLSRAERRAARQVRTLEPRETDGEGAPRDEECAAGRDTQVDRRGPPRGERREGRLETSGPGVIRHEEPGAASEQPKLEREIMLKNGDADGGQRVERLRRSRREFRGERD